MPYIKPERKAIIEEGWSYLANYTPGDLNYRLTLLIINYIQCKQGRIDIVSYQTINDIIGALECCKLEFVRRVVNPFEDFKIKQNGDVYD